MSVKEFKPYTPGRRAMSSQSYEDVTKSEPERALTAALKKSGGRHYYAPSWRRSKTSLSSYRF